MLKTKQTNHISSLAEVITHNCVLTLKSVESPSLNKSTENWFSHLRGANHVNTKQ